jgi:hypothetical protein
MIFIKEFFLIGSRYFNEIRLVSTYDLEVVRIYRFYDDQGKGYLGGFIDAAPLG